MERERTLKVAERNLESFHGHLVGKENRDRFFPKRALWRRPETPDGCAASCADSCIASCAAGRQRSADVSQNILLILKRQ